MYGKFWAYLGNISKKANKGKSPEQFKKSAEQSAYLVMKLSQMIECMLIIQILGLLS